MNKLFVFAILCVAVIAEVTSKECKAQTEKGGLCPECSDANSEKCKAAKEFKEGANADIFKQMACASVAPCYKKAKEDAEKKAKEEYAAKTKKHCPTDKKECKDIDAFCPTWKKNGECKENPDWMLANCGNSCCQLCNGEVDPLDKGKCPEKDMEAQCVSNKNKQCGKWADAGECDKNAEWMKSNCMESCCSTCEFNENGCPKSKENCANIHGADEDDDDKDKQCDKWAKAGECTKNSKWMLKNCAKSCCPVCAAKAPAKATVAPAVRPVVRQPFYQQPYQPIAQPRVAAQPVFGGYSTGAMAAPRFGTYGGLPYGAGFGR